MTLTLYDDGKLYGDADAFYGRIDAGMASAQLQKIRETGLKVSIINEQINKWDVVVSDATAIWVPDLYPPPPAADSGSEIEITNRWNRGQSTGVKLDNGTVVRFRIGTHTDPNDRQMWYQTITDLENVSQWESWSLLYSGRHYSLGVVQTGPTTYDLYHTKDDGFNINNSLQWATAVDGQSLRDIIYITPLRGQYDYVNIDGYQLNRVVYFSVLKPDYTEPPYLQRYFDIYGSSDIINEQPQPEPSLNLRWYQNFMQPIQRTEDPERAVFLNTMLYLQHPRATNFGSSITARDSLSWYLDLFEQPPILIRGLAGGAGHNWLSQPHPWACSDGYYYMFYGEAHFDDFWETNQTAPFLIAWQRSKDLIHWSEPVIIPTGTLKFNGGAAMFEAEVNGTNYLYIAANGPVLRRPVETLTTDISNYVTEVNWDTPRDNQEGTGSLTVANPSGVNDYLKDLGDRRIKIELGIKPPNGAFQFAQLDDFWIRRIRQSDADDKNQLTIEFGNIWTRLTTQLRDTFNIIGKTEYQDFTPGKTNEPFNYFFDGGTGTRFGDSLNLSGGKCLWTGWKGHNPDFTVQFYSYASYPISIVFRYVDAQNYYDLSLSNANLLVLTRVKRGVQTQIASINISGNIHQMVGAQRFGVKVNNSRIFVYLNYTIINGYTDTDPVLAPGYVGFWGAAYIAHFNFTDYEFDWRSSDLVKFALAMADYHDVSYGGPNDKQYALVWGPQTDLQTPADGLRQVLESEKGDVVWQNGRLVAGQFTSTVSTRTLQDEILETTLINEVERRINLSVVDGNEHSWLEVDFADVRLRDRQVIEYLDLPELLTKDAARARAKDSIAKAARGESPGGPIPLQFDLWRMDVITWIDRLGNSYTARIEGMSVEVNQSTEPRQIQELDLSLI